LCSNTQRGNRRQTAFVSDDDGVPYPVPGTTFVGLAHELIHKAYGVVGGTTGENQAVRFENAVRWEHRVSLRTKYLGRHIAQAAPHRLIDWGPKGALPVPMPPSAAKKM